MSVTIDHESNNDLDVDVLILMLISGHGATAFSMISNLSRLDMVLLVTVSNRQFMSSWEYLHLGINVLGSLMFDGPGLGSF